MVKNPPLSSSAGAPPPASRLQPWHRAYTIEQLERAPSLAPDAWYRLIPLGGPEAAELVPPRPRKDERGLPLAWDPVVDRKLAPLYDLMDFMLSPELLCSERLVEALCAIGATGWSARVVPHATPNAVAGHRIYRLSCVGWTGPLLDTEMAGGAAPVPVHGVDTILRGRPMPPVSFDATPWTGHDLCWSSWFGGPAPVWRALIVTGPVAQAIAERIPDRILGMEPVRMVGAGARPDRPPGTSSGGEEPPLPPAPPLPDVLQRVARESIPHRHTLPPGAPEATIRSAFAALGAAPPEGLVHTLEASDGPTLFGGALRIYPAGDNETLADMNDMVRTSGYATGEGMVAFAETRTAEVVWAFDPAGDVRGLGREGILYGPAAPFSRWLADQIADLAWAWENADAVPWASRMFWT